MKEIKDDINRWRDIPCSWLGIINIVKMTMAEEVGNPAEERRKMPFIHVV